MTSDLHSPTGPETKEPADSSDSTVATLEIYGEICKTYLALDDFRMKLLGFLPVASLLGIFGLNSETMLLKSGVSGDEMIFFISGFSAMFTLFLFLYEIRGTIKCSGLIRVGTNIERSLNIQGQFCMCTEQSETLPLRGKIRRLLNAQFIASLVYSSVFASWLFMVLRYGLHMSIPYCTIYAIASGLGIGVAAYWIFFKTLLRQVDKKGTE
jgi:hypothetical protein